MTPVQGEFPPFPTQQKSKCLKKTKKKWVILKSPNSYPKHCSGTQNSFYSPALHSRPATSAPFIIWEFACCSSAWQVFPPHAIDPLKVVQTSLATCNVHQEPRKKLLSSLEFCTNHHTEILPEFLPVSFPWDGAYSWNYSEPLGREQGSGQPFQGSFKSYFLRNQCHCYNC